MKNAYVYILSNKPNGTLYVGVTSDIIKRIYEHKQGNIDSFSKKYNLKKLVYFEIFDDIEAAIIREKQLKSGNRQKKIALIKSINSEWKDLYEEIL